MKTFYFDAQHAIDVQGAIIEKSGGKPGVKDRGRLDSVLHHIQNDDYYPEFLDKLTHLCFAVNKFHAFNDGNKRASLALGAFFLLINGYDHCVGQFMREMENIVVWVADGLIEKALLREIIQDIVMQEAREEVRLAIIHAVQPHPPGDEAAQADAHADAHADAQDAAEDAAGGAS